MNNRDNQPPFDGRRSRSRDGDQPLDVEALLRAFPGRLDRLKEASGLSWSGLARTLGVDRKQTRRWSNGAEPRGGSVLSVFHFGDRIPGGLDILLGQDTEPGLTGDEDDEGEDQDYQAQDSKD